MFIGHFVFHEVKEKEYSIRFDWINILLWRWQLTTKTKNDNRIGLYAFGCVLCSRVELKWCKTARLLYLLIMISIKVFNTNVLWIPWIYWPLIYHIYLWPSKTQNFRFRFVYLLLLFVSGTQYKAPSSKEEKKCQRREFYRMKMVFLRSYEWQAITSVASNVMITSSNR